MTAWTREATHSAGNPRRGVRKPVKIETAPFYAFPSTAYILGTYGGILTNEKAEVVDVFGQTVAASMRRVRLAAASTARPT